ncbi:MAG: 5-formyltetrahydrofolate cyclo-ligase [Prevotella sp.]|nr:5-formyltetrahydrofolate cyclo-ligase [Prevotella sp.]
MDKRELRNYIRQQKRQYTSEELRVLSLPIINRLLEHPRIQSAQTILMYHSLPDEVYTHDALDQLVAEGKSVYLPVVVADGLMDIQEYHGRNDLQQGAFHIMEPSTPHFEPQTPNLEPRTSNLSPLGESEGASLDVAVIPGMAFDKDGNRLGRGKGYYDRFLSSLHTPHSTFHTPHSTFHTPHSTPPYTIGLCFPFQKVEHIPTTPLDIPVEEVL